MRYQVESYLPTFSTNSKYANGKVVYNAARGEFLLAEKWEPTEKDQYGQGTIKITTPEAEQLTLTAFDHLLLGINIVAYLTQSMPTPFYIGTKLTFRQEAMYALQVASQTIPIAHYYMAKLLEFLDGVSAQREIDEHYRKARTASDASQEFQKEFDEFVPQCKQLTADDLKTYQAVLEDISKYHSKGFSDLTDTDLLNKLKKEAIPLEEQGRCLYELAKRYNAKDELETLKYALTAAVCCDNQDGLKFVKENSKKFPDLESYFDILKNGVSGIPTFEKKLNFIECYLGLYHLYRYLHERKDVKPAFFSFDSVNQDVRRDCYVRLLSRLFDGKVKDDVELLKWINARSTDGDFKQTDYSLGLGLITGKQGFYDLLLKLVDMVSIQRDISHLVAASKCILDCLKSQEHLSDSFARKLFLTANKASDKEEVRVFHLEIGEASSSRLGVPAEEVAQQVHTAIADSSL